MRMRKSAPTAHAVADPLERQAGATGFWQSSTASRCRRLAGLPLVKPSCILTSPEGHEPAKDCSLACRLRAVFGLGTRLLLFDWMTGSSFSLRLHLTTGVDLIQPSINIALAHTWVVGTRKAHHHAGAHVLRALGLPLRVVR